MVSGMWILFPTLPLQCQEGMDKGGVEFGHSIHTHTQVRVSPLSVLPCWTRSVHVLAQNTHFS